MSLKPLRQAFSGQTDANGNATIVIPAPGGTYVVGNIVGDTKGNAQWKVNVGGQLVHPGRGPTAVMGPIFISPQESITVQVTGALANTSISGSLVGSQSDLISEVMQTYSPSPHPLALDALNTQILLGSILTAGNGVAVAKTFPLPGGTQGVGYLIDQNAGHSAPTTASGITMVGSASAYPYITFGTHLAVGSSFTENAGSTEFFASIDPSVICTVKDPNVGTPTLVYFYAYTYNPKTRSDVSPQGTAVPVNLTQVNSAAVVTSTKASATLNNSTTVLIAAAAGVTLSILGFTGVIDTSAVGSSVQFEDTNGNLISFHAANKSDYGYFPFGNGNYLLAAGVGLQVHNPLAVAASINGTVFSQVQ